VFEEIVNSIPTGVLHEDRSRLDFKQSANENKKFGTTARFSTSSSTAFKAAVPHQYQPVGPMIVTSPNLAKILVGSMQPIRERIKKFSPRRNTLLGPGPGLEHPDKFDLYLKDKKARTIKKSKIEINRDICRKIYFPEWESD
jgi:hypothetical protein